MTSKLWNTSLPRTRIIAEAGVFIALNIILSRFASITLIDRRISLTFLVFLIAGARLGALPTAAIGLVADVLGATLFPVGAFNPGLTLTAALSGFWYGLFLYPRITLPRALGLLLVQQWGTESLINSYFLKAFTGNPYWVTVATRVPFHFMMTVLKTAALLALTRNPFARLIRTPRNRT